jgi:hypothetical protein
MRKLFTTLMAIITAASGFAADITIDAGKITDLNWTNDNVYRINGWAYVDSMDVLTIQAGTVIKGFPGEAESSSALIVSRGGRIVANGTAAEPIIFTALADDLAGSVPVHASGLWGGVIVLGYGQTNNGSQKSIEGISAELEFGLFGGTEEEEVEDQDAGEMSYLSIRHGGTNIGEGNEINGLTMGACGSGTTISFVEVIANQDDGIELFGGAPRLDHFIVAFCGDDGYDLDHGVRSWGQFLLDVQDTASWGECFGEHDGGSGSGETSPFIAHTIFSNVSYIGNTSAGGADKKAFVLRDNWSGEYHNSIFYDTPIGIYLEWREDKTNSYDRLMADEIVFADNIFSQVADNTPEGICVIVDDQGNNVPIDTATYKKAQFVAKFNTWNNDLSTDPGISPTNPVPTGDVSGTDYTGMDAWFEQVSYKGAFDPEITCGHWAGGWTLIFADVDYIMNAADCEEPPEAVEHSDFDAHIRVYPNPASEYAVFTFTNAASEVFTLNIYNNSGQKVLTAATGSSSLELDVNNMTPGLYTFSLRNADSSVNSVGQLIIN